MRITREDFLMKRVHLLPVAALMLVAACASDSSGPLAPARGPSFDNQPPKPGAHFQSADATLSGSDLIVSFREVGLGEGDVTVTATADATAAYACQNNGGQFPNAANKQSVTGPVSTTGVFPVSKNGHIEGSLTLSPPASTLDCPGGQTAVLTSVTYSNVTLTDETNQVTTTIPGTYSAVFYENVP
jgi:hypothetical protein